MTICNARATVNLRNLGVGPRAARSLIFTIVKAQPHMTNHVFGKYPSGQIARLCANNAMLRHQKAICTRMCGLSESTRKASSLDTLHIPEWSVIKKSALIGKM